MSGALFKKEFNERSRTLLKNKDTRAFKQNLIDQFRGLDADTLGEIFASKTQQVYMGKIGSGTKDVLYSISDNEPLAVDLNSKNELLPTLFFLSKFPTAVRQFVVHSPVSEYVLNGADLMMPGVCTAEGLEDIQLNEIVSIRVKGNPIPFAVGLSLVSWEGIQCNGMRGRAVRVLHYFGDMMCHRWNRNAPINAGFSLSRIRALPGYSEVGALAETEDIDDQLEAGAADEVPGEVDGGDGAEQLKESAEGGPVDSGDTESAAPDGQEGLAEGAAGDGAPGGGAVLTEAEMDLALETCLLRALHYVVKDRHLPILVSSLWALLLRCSLEDEPKLDVKRSTARKVGVFLQRYSTDGADALLEVVTEENGVSHVLRVNRAHGLFRCPTGDPELDAGHCNAGRRAAAAAAAERSLAADPGGAVAALFGRVADHAYRVPDAEGFKTRLRPVLEGDADSVTAPATAVAAAAVGQGIVGDHVRSLRGKQGALKILELYRPSRPFREMLGGTVHGEFGECLTAAEVRNVMLSYLTERSFPVAEGGASVEVPTDDPLYKHIQLAKLSAARQGEKGASAPASSAPASSAPASSAPPIPEAAGWDDEEDPSSDDDRAAHSGGGSVIAGVYMPSVSDFLQQSAASMTLIPGGGASGTATSAGNTGRLSTRELLSEKGSGKPVELPRAAPKAAKAAKGGVAQPALPANGGRADQVGSDRSNSALGKTKLGQARSKASVEAVPLVPVVIQKKEVVKETISRFSPYYVVINSSGEWSVSSGGIPEVQIDVEKRSGNKMVTKLSGISPFGIDGNALARECQRKFACSASFAASPSRVNTMEITIQGFVTDELSQLLVESYGLPKGVIVINLAKGVKAKKKY